MTKTELEKRVLEQEQRMMALISGNVRLMSEIERLKAENLKLRHDTENVLNVLRKRDDELYNRLDMLQNEYDKNKNRLLNDEVEINNLKLFFNEFIVRHEKQCKMRNKDKVKIISNENDLPF